jgi:NDP-sugar pyrophosphorylase family protein
MRTLSSIERHGTAIVTSAMLSPSSAEAETPLLALGGQPVICHIVWQLNLADLKSLIIVTGIDGRAVKAAVQSLLADAGHDD